MTKKLDTSWFDLKNYDKLNKLDLQGWVSQISLRNLVYQFDEAALAYQEVIKNNPIYTPTNMTHGDYYAAKRYQETLKINPNAIDTYVKDDDERVCIVEGDWRNNGSKLPFNTYSVRGTPLISHVHIANDPKLDLDCIFDERKTGFTADMIYKEQNIDRFGDDITHVTVDLAASDEQIMGDFRHWLTEYRKVTGRVIIKKSFTQSDFDYWIQYGVIPYLDLMLIAKIEDKKITQNQLARLIFPDEYDVDIVGRLRQVTKPEAEKLIKGEVREALITQLEGGNGMKNT